MPAFMGQPVRSYPLRIINEPAMYVLGEKAGQKVPYPPQRASHASHPAAHPQGAPMGGMQHPQAMIAAQNREMDSLERRQARERGAAAVSVRGLLRDQFIQFCNVWANFVYLSTHKLMTTIREVN